jgi:chorismate mutase
VLILWNTDKRADEIAHVYIKEAANLRPDWSHLPPVDWADLEGWIANNLNKAARPIR